MFQTEVVEIIKKLFFSFFFFLENRAVYEIMWKKYYRVCQVTDDNMAHALGMLDN